jgi:hypothetical protein
MCSGAKGWIRESIHQAVDWSPDSVRSREIIAIEVPHASYLYSTSYPYPPNYSTVSTAKQLTKVRKQNFVEYMFFILNLQLRNKSIIIDLFLSYLNVEILTWDI